MKSFRFALRPTWFALACHGFSVCGLAAPLSDDSRPVVITGTVLPRTLGSEIAATSVLTRDDIERAGMRDLVSTLKLLGTAQVEQQGGPGTSAVVRLRGADSRDTLVLIDGVPLTDVTTGLASLAQLSTGDIERVEVVRGNMSALYGANATGGVIQVFTRRGAQGFDAHVAGGVGSRATRWASASVSGGHERLQARLTVSGERTNGFSAADPAAAPTANPDADGNKRRSIALAVDSPLSPGHSLGLDLRALSGTVDYDSTSTFSAPTDTHESHTVQRGATLRGRHALGEAWSLNWHVAKADEIRNDTSVTGFGASQFGNALHNRSLMADIKGALTDAWTLQLGAERLSQSTDNATYTRRSRETNTLRLGATYDASWGSAQANLRHDRTSDFGSVDTGLLGGTLKLGHGFSAIASVSTSFTPPSLDFLFFDCTPFGFTCSNPNLKPERARNVDLGLQWEQGVTLLRATLFHARYRDKIANDALFIPQNVAQARNTGLELSARTKLGAWRLSGEASLQKPVDANTGARLIRRAREQFALRGDYEHGAWSTGASVRYVGARPDQTPGGVATRLAPYAVVDLSARWLLTPQWTLQASVDNVFDRAYAPAYGYNGKPRGLFVSLGWQARP